MPAVGPKKMMRIDIALRLTVCVLFAVVCGCSTASRSTTTMTQYEEHMHAKALYLKSQLDGLDRELVWRAAEGHEANRMAMGLVPYSFPIDQSNGFFRTTDVFRTLWNDGKSTNLVCLQYPGIELGGTPYRAFVYDKSLNLVKWGETNLPEGAIPLALVEVRASGALPAPFQNSFRVPPKLDDVWQLAVVAVNPTVKLKEGDLESVDSLRSCIRVIDWAGDGVDWPGYGYLHDIQDLEVRSAESNWPVLHNP